MRDRNGRDRNGATDPISVPCCISTKRSDVEVALRGWCLGLVLEIEWFLHHLESVTHQAESVDGDSELILRNNTVFRCRSSHGVVRVRGHPMWQGF